MSKTVLEVYATGPGLTKIAVQVYTHTHTHFSCCYNEKKERFFFH